MYLAKHWSVFVTPKRNGYDAVSLFEKKRNFKGFLSKVGAILHHIISSQYLASLKRLLVIMDCVLIRKFEPADQSTVRSMYRACMNQYDHLGLAGLCYSSFVEQMTAPDGDMSNIQKVFMESKNEKKSCFWVAVIDGKIVGFVGAKPTTKFSADYVELVRMLVLPESRQHGVGRKLVKALEDWAIQEGYRNIHLTCITLLDESNKFYAKCGFFLRETEEFDVSEQVGIPSTFERGNHHVKPIMAHPEKQNVVIRSFEPRDQNTVKWMFRGGEHNYAHIPIVGKRYAWNVRDKTKPSGDLSDIQHHFFDSSAEGRRKGHFWVAEIDGVIVGFVGAKYSLKFEDDTVELVRMAVSPQCRKLGVGRKLVAALEKWAKEDGCKCIKLFTLAGLPDPNQLYPKCGFVVTQYETADVTQQLELSEPTTLSIVHYAKSI